MTGQDFINKAETKIGLPYVLGVVVPKNDANYDSAFDCAEFVSWVVYQVIGKLYGCINDNTSHPESADAGTIYWNSEVNKGSVKIISIDQAARTAGAILLRNAGDGLDGHIVFSKGDGTTVEAHGRRDGVVNNVVTGRRWSTGILIPTVDYAVNQKDVPVVITPQVYRVKSPFMQGGLIGSIQKALNGFGYAVSEDGIYGNNTALAVRNFQNKKGLTPDGEVGKETLEVMGI